jgi:hypothetical protein
MFGRATLLSTAVATAAHPSKPIINGKTELFRLMVTGKERISGGQQGNSFGNDKLIKPEGRPKGQIRQIELHLLWSFGICHS